MSLIHNMHLIDQSGNFIDVVNLDGVRYIGAAIVQNVIASTKNSTTTDLTIGQVFTGESESTLGIGAIQINVKSDTNLYIELQQSMDNTYQDITDSFNYYYSKGGDGRTFQATASYFRITVKNVCHTTSTYLRVQTAIAPTIEAIPRALTSDGNLKVATEELLCTFGSSVMSTPMNQIRTSHNVRLIGASLYDSTLDPNFQTKTVKTGSSDATGGDGQLTMFTGVTANSSIIVTSNRIARYIPSNSNYYRGVIRIPDAGVTNNIRRWGMYDSTCGYYFYIDGTIFGVAYRKNSVDTTIPTGSFNGIFGSEYTLGTNALSFEIYLNNVKQYFVINGNLIHTISADTSTTSNTFNLPIRFENTNRDGGTTDTKLEVRSSTVNRLGLLQTMPQYKNITGDQTTILKFGAGTLIRVTVNRKTSNSGILTLYDGITAAGTQIAVIDGYNAPGGAFDYGLQFNVGLTIVTSTTGSGDYTIIYE